MTVRIRNHTPIRRDSVDTIKRPCFSVQMIKEPTLLLIPTHSWYLYLSGMAFHFMWVFLIFHRKEILLKGSAQCWGPNSSYQILSGPVSTYFPFEIFSCLLWHAHTYLFFLTVARVQRNTASGLTGSNPFLVMLFGTILTAWQSQAHLVHRVVPSLENSVTFAYSLCLSWFKQKQKGWIWRFKQIVWRKEML